MGVVRHGKRTTTERERDRMLTLEMYLEGRHQLDIRDVLNAREDVSYTISQQQISADLKIIRTRWMQSQIRDFDAHQAEELAKLERLEQEYWAAWRAVEPTDRTAPAYLNGVGNCVEQRRKLLGLDAPSKVALDGSIGVRRELTDLSQLSDEDLAQLEAILAKAANAGGSTDGAGQAET